MLQYLTSIIVEGIFRSLYRAGTNWPTPQLFLQNKSYQVFGRGESHCQIGRVQDRPSRELLAYTIDENIQERKTISNFCLTVPLKDIDSTIVWGPNNIMPIIRKSSHNIQNG